MTHISQITNIHHLARDIHDQWINARPHPTRPDLTILSYTDRTQYSGHWIADTTLIARGLALQLTPHGTAIARRLGADWGKAAVDDITETLDGAQVIARGMRKFFTIEASKTDWGRIQLVDDDENVTVDDNATGIDLDAPASVADKLDGALGIGIPIDGRMTLATKGAFQSEEAAAGTRILQRHNPQGFARFMAERLPDWTPLFEIITPNGLHIVQYGDLDDVILLGLLHNPTGWWTPAALLATDPRTKDTDAASIPERFHFRTPELYSATTLGEALGRPELANHEGMVATLDHGDHQDMFKIKYATYLLLNHWKEQTSGKALKTAILDMPAGAILDGRLPDMAAQLPAEAVDAARPILDRLDADARNLIQPIADTSRRALDMYDRLSAGLDLSTRDGAKEYAARISNTDLTRAERSILFALKKSDGTPEGLRRTAADSARSIMLK